MKKRLSTVNCFQLPVFKLFLFLLIVHYSLLIAHGLAHAATADEIVNDLQKKLSVINEIKGSFSQSSYIKDIEETQKYSGKFFIKKPSRMMWEYEKPRDEKVLIRGNDTLIYRESLKQAIKTKFSSEAYSQVPIALLESFENIRSDYDFKMTSEGALQLTPKRKIGFLKTLVLETSAEDFPVKMFTIFDTYGNIIMIELSKVEINTGLNDSFFNIDIPSGTEIFDMSSEQAGMNQ